jgi:hypothetical protein
MKPLSKLGIASLFVAGAAGAAAFLSYRKAMKEAGAAWDRIASRRTAAPARYDPAMVADLPEVAQRYFNHAIAPGTPLRKTVRIEMRGTFLLGDRHRHQSYRMTARQILAPPSSFVWLPRMWSGPVSISGSDALVDGTAWTRFWLLGLVRVADEAASPDLVRSATFRSTMEAVWAPASLLPENGVRWEQIGPHEARITVESVTPAIVMEMSLTADGTVREIVGMRWSNANPEKEFRLQPFGGTIKSEGMFEGFTIPTRVNAGNHFGTDDYLPFFQAEVVKATYR